MDGMITEDGRLNPEFGGEREALYTGLNGCTVERVRISPGESYVFKPLAEGGNSREAWAYEHVRPSLPGLFPRLIARSADGISGQGWLLFEDLGPLSHRFNEGTAAALIGQIARWHALPTASFGIRSRQGPKPTIGEMAEALRQNEEEWVPYLEEFRWPKASMRSLIAEALELERSESVVFSHGDLHLGNYAMTAGGIRVLDWEHAHLNSRHWDLFHVLDLSHPLFPKTMNPGMRDRLLERYLDAAEAFGLPSDRTRFRREYYVFSSVFSLWLLLLIERDLRREDGVWPANKLEEQRLETLENLRQCLASFIILSYVKKS